MKYFKIHRMYLFNKINIIIIVFVLIISIGIYLLNIYPFLKEVNYFRRDLINTSYLQTQILTFKLLIIPLNTFIWGNAFSKEGEDYHYIILDYEKDKWKYLCSKIILLIIVNIIIYLIALIVIKTSGTKICSWFDYQGQINQLYLSFLFLSIIYGTISSILTYLLKTSFACFIPLGLFVITEVLNENFNQQLFSIVFNVFFPTISNVKTFTSFGYIHLFFLMLVYLLIMNVIYFKPKQKILSKHVIKKC